MKFGVNTVIWSAGIGGEVLNLLPSIRESGFDGVELPLIRLTEIPVRKIRAGLGRTELECTFCSVLPRESTF
jgi:D-psicose/D-tagatose/L-ribulose 3-epimerase